MISHIAANSSAVASPPGGMKWKALELRADAGAAIFGPTRGWHSWHSLTEVWKYFWEEYDYFVVYKKNTT
jgi:hypothetical protein